MWTFQVFLCGSLDATASTAGVTKSTQTELIKMNTQLMLNLLYSIVYIHTVPSRRHVKLSVLLHDNIVVCSLLTWTSTCCDRSQKRKKVSAGSQSGIKVCPCKHRQYYSFLSESQRLPQITDQDFGKRSLPKYEICNFCRAAKHQSGASSESVDLVT